MMSRSSAANPKRATRPSPPRTSKSRGMSAGVPMQSLRLRSGLGEEEHEAIAGAASFGWRGGRVVPVAHVGRIAQETVAGLQDEPGPTHLVADRRLVDPMQGLHVGDPLAGARAVVDDG